MLVVFKRNLTVQICNETNFHSGEFTFKTGYGYDGYWKNKDTVVVKYDKIRVFICGDHIDKYLT